MKFIQMPRAFSTTSRASENLPQACTVVSSNPGRRARATDRSGCTAKPVGEIRHELHSPERGNHSSAGITARSSPAPGMTTEWPAVRPRPRGFRAAGTTRVSACGMCHPSRPAAGRAECADVLCPGCQHVGNDVVQPGGGHRDTCVRGAVVQAKLPGFGHVSQSARETTPGTSPVSSSIRTARAPIPRTGRAAPWVLQVQQQQADPVERPGHMCRLRAAPRPRVMVR
jgi:hypothetical protein